MRFSNVSNGYKSDKDNPRFGTLMDSSPDYNILNLGVSNTRRGHDTRSIRESPAAGMRGREDRKIRIQKSRYL